MGDGCKRLTRKLTSQGAHRCVRLNTLINFVDQLVNLHTDYDWLGSNAMTICKQTSPYDGGDVIEETTSRSRHSDYGRVPVRLHEFDARK